MIQQDHLKTLLEHTFADRLLDSHEKSTLFKVFQNLGRDERAFVRNRAFDMVRTAQNNEDVHPLLSWLQSIIKSLDNSQPDTPQNTAYFSPGSDCEKALLQAIQQAQHTIDICVFTISDNDLRDALLQAHKKGVVVRIITDNDKTLDLGSDIDTLADKGIRVRTDQTRHHMHHKFAVFDNKQLFTGSFNWTRSASLYNHENLVLLEDGETLSAFNSEFATLWQSFTPHQAP